MCTAGYEGCGDADWSGAGTGEASKGFWIGARHPCALLLSQSRRSGNCTGVAGNCSSSAYPGFEAHPGKLLMGSENIRKITVALAGNPNVGKSTLFNALTGLHQHTGNWPGKTVGVAQGTMRRGDTQYALVDLPGTYSLDGKSEDERIAAEFLESGKADCTVVVCDGSCLERSLILALQILQQTDRVVICVNLIDEAKRHGIWVDAERLSRHLEPKHRQKRRIFATLCAQEGAPQVWGASKGAAKELHKCQPRRAYSQHLHSPSAKAQPQSHPPRE